MKDNKKDKINPVCTNVADPVCCASKYAKFRIGKCTSCPLATLNRKAQDEEISAWPPVDIHYLTIQPTAWQTISPSNKNLSLVKYLYRCVSYLKYSRKRRPMCPPTSIQCESHWPASSSERI